jgi:hypothetical protein
MQHGNNAIRIISAATAALLVAACETGPAAPEEAEGVAAFGHEAGAHAHGDGFVSTAAHNHLLASIRQATARYHDLDQAMADGYAQASGCVSTPSGGMGYHYMNGALLQDGVLDPLRPEALLYEPMRNGRLRLVAVEYVIVAGPWDAVNESAPRLGAREFDDHRPPGSGGPPFPHYQLHAWVWKHNPAGVHTPFNPAVTCDWAD